MSSFGHTGAPSRLDAPNWSGLKTQHPWKLGRGPRGGCGGAGVGGEPAALSGGGALPPRGGEAAPERRGASGLERLQPEPTRRQALPPTRKMAAPVMKSVAESLGSPEPAVRLILSLGIGKIRSQGPAAAPPSPDQGTGGGG